MTSELCAQLFEELKRVGSPLISLLQPGIPREMVDKKLGAADVGISFPDEVYSLYEWKNGVEDDESSEYTVGELRLFTLGIFDSFDVAKGSYLEWSVRGDYWPRELFPLFESCGGDYYLIDTNAHSSTYRMIMFYSPSNPYFQGVASIFDSLDSCLTSIIECYRKQAYFFTSGSRSLETRPEIVNEIWEKNNPNSEYFRILEKYK